MRNVEKCIARKLPGKPEAASSGEVALSKEPAAPIRGAPLNTEKMFLSGNEAIALGALEAGALVGTGYPGTPSTEILETLAVHDEIYTEWSVNEKVALEVALGAAWSGARSIVTMKHVGLNVAADPLFTAAYTGVKAGLVVVSADDPGMHSSQNEQDNRNYGCAAKIPVLEPSDSQEAKDFTKRYAGIAKI